jgi:hypothetical protein
MESSVSPPAAALTPPELADLRDVALRERERGGRHEVVAREALARLQVLKAKTASAVFLPELLALLLRQLPETVAGGREVDRTRDGHVGPDPGQRLEHLRLRVVEALRERRARDHEPDADREPERRQDRPAAPAAELREHVGQVEHSAPQPNSAS